MLALLRRRRKMALKGFSIAGVILIIALVGPHALLFAEQNAQTAAIAPMATPTPMPADFYDKLPICPDDILTPSVEPTAIPDPDATPSCRISPDWVVATIDIKALYDQGADLAAMGFPGDPDPASALTDPAATPFVTIEVPQLLPRLYLPFVDAGARPAAAASDPTAPVAPTATPNYTATLLGHPYIPIDQLPECEDVTVSGPDYSAPSYDAPQCRARIVASVDIKALYDQGVDLAARGLPQDPPPGSAPLILGTPVAQAAVAAGTPAPGQAAPQITPRLYLPFVTTD